MADTLFLLATTGFFGLCAAYVRGCARIVGAPAADPAPGGGHAPSRGAEDPR
ncbi:hypothetical protein ACFVWN_28170 [Nocardiopsis flavescens]|uniref:Uncharacterized protein n=1 Tax=Nocardiopsis flavescens TaxID=758803 RepID=A0A1M6L3X7_9ACTN|nr:hypothetical protein [Nocardiopsis flavescens]SHJ65945.1 hypothetical protein SAMN05421803_10867 [Nocardiopsis flavescens]